MKRADWDKLCRNIYEKKCILLIGPEFPIELRQSGELKSTTFSALLSEKLRHELNEHPHVPIDIKNSLAKKEIAQLAGDYIKYTETDRKTSRDNLEFLISDFLVDEINLQSDEFKRLTQLPFTVVVDTTYGNFFYNEYQETGKTPEKSYYNFHGKKIELVRSFSSESLGSEFSPFIYNLFGSIENSDSLVLSENELIEFVINLISKNPGLPSNVKSELSDPDRYFLFLGFGIVSKNWYFRILLQALESNNKGSMSYALEQINNIGNDDEPTIVFFRDELKLSLYPYDQTNFINDLIESYEQYQSKRRKFTPEESSLQDAPRAFISYKSEDFNVAIEIYHRLRKSGIDAWLDQERIKGLWEPSLYNEINTTDAFILLQSQTLKSSTENYVHAEIKAALERCKRFQTSSDFLFPTYIDSKNSILSLPNELNQINSYDLSNIDNVEILVKDIKRTYERNKRKNVA